MMSGGVLRLLACAPLLGMAACSPGTCDPAQADFFSGIAGQASGCYQARNDALQSNLQSARLDLAQQAANARAANADRQDAESQRDMAQARLRAMGRDLAALRRRLAAASRQDTVDRVALQRQQSDLDTLEHDRQAALSHGADPAAVQDLERRRKALLDSATSY